MSSTSHVDGRMDFRAQKRYVRGPYKKKRDKKIDSKQSNDDFDQSSQNSGKRHQSTIQKAAIARQILTKIESNTVSVKVQEIREEEPSAADTGDCAPKVCNCTSSGCLKLYCECFKNNRFCNGGCRCNGCSNCKEHE